MTFWDKFCDWSLVKGAGDQQYDVVNHVTVPVKSQSSYKDTAAQHIALSKQVISQSPTLHRLLADTMF